MSAETQSTSTGSKLVLPSADTLSKALKLSIKLTKPIDCYFYLDSIRDRVCIMNDRRYDHLQNDDEHTSPILKTIQV